MQLGVDLAFHCRRGEKWRLRVTMSVESNRAGLVGWERGSCREGRGKRAGTITRGKYF